jgi:hypothetical protein
LFLILAFLSNLRLLSVPFYRISFLFQVAFYALALFQALIGGGLKNRYLSFPYYFCHGNAAALVAFTKFLKGERIVVWQPLRR